MAKTYAETPTSVSTFTGAELVVVQTGSTPAPQGFPEMKKTTLQDIKSWMTEGVVGGLKYKGSCTWSELQSKTGMAVGDMWNVTDREGQNYAWTGSVWDALGETKDLSGIEGRLDAVEEGKADKTEVTELASALNETTERLGWLKLSLTNEGLLHIEEVSA